MPVFQRQTGAVFMGLVYQTLIAVQHVVEVQPSEFQRV
jgi:hypothetical protein